MNLVYSITTQSENRKFPVGYTTAYRFGFNGQEKDDEVVGTGNLYTAEFWEYDARLGRRWNIDPVDKPWMSPYHAFSNSPIWKVDPNGANDDEYIKDTETGETKKISDKGGSELDIVHYGTTVKEGDAKGAFKATRTEIIENGAHTNIYYNSNGSTKYRPEYRSYGWSPEQNTAAAKFMLSTTVGIMTGGLASAYSLGGTGLMAAAGQYGTGALTRSGLDLATQLAVNGGDMSKVDFADVGMAAVFNAKYSTVLGSLVDFRGGQLQVSGINKSLSSTGIDLFTKSAFGGMGLGGKATTALAPLNAPQLNFLFQLPINLSGKITGKMLKDATN